MQPFRKAPRPGAQQAASLAYDSGSSMGAASVLLRFRQYSSHSAGLFSHLHCLPAAQRCTYPLTTHNGATMHPYEVQVMTLTREPFLRSAHRVSMPTSTSSEPSPRPISYG